MKFRFLLVAVALLIGSISSYGQLLQWNTFGNLGTETTEPSVANDANIAAANLTQGSLITGANGNRFGGSNWFDTGDTNPTTLAESITGNDYIQFTVTPNSGFSFTPTSFVFYWDRSETGPPNVALRSSVDGYAADLGTVTGMVSGGSATTTARTITITGLSNITTATTFRLYGYGATGTTGTGGFDQPTALPGFVNVILNGTTASSGPYTVASGDWNVATTWSTNPVVPISTDNVTISTGHTVYTTTALTRTGTTAVNGTFELRNGGSASGTNFNFNTTTSGLNFNDSANYAVNNTDVFWPATNGPFNVTVLQGGMTMNATTVRTVAGIFQTANNVTITSPSTLTLNGTCQINTGGFFNNSPIYGSSSTLIYNTDGTFNRGNEWQAFGVGTIGSTPGYPNNIQLSNNTTFDYNNGTPLAKAINGNLTIDAGSSFYMDFGAGASGGFLTVAGNVTNNGNFTLGNAVGDDLKIGGNFSNGASGVFNGNNRALYFTKAGVQMVSNAAAATLTFPYVILSGGTTVQLINNLIISAPLGGNAISFTNASDIIDLNGRTLTIGTAGVANTISGLGTFKGSTASNIFLDGTGCIGTLNFTTGFQNLGTLVVNRTSGAIGCVMGTPVTINTTLALTAGIVDLNNTTMTLAAAATITGASVNNYVIADVANGTSASLRKTLTAAGTFAFPIGDSSGSAGGSQYSPVSVTFTDGTYAGYAGFAVNDIKQPDMVASTHFITRYWAMTSLGIAPMSYAVTGTYLAADINGTEGSSQSNQWNGTTWTNGGAPISSNTMTIGGCTTLPATNHFSAGKRDPEINIVQDTTTYLTTSIYNFGSVVVGSSPDATFTIQNLGQESLSLGTGASVPVLVGNPIYTLSSSYTGSSVGPLVTTYVGDNVFTINFNPTVVGTFTGSITIYSNDSDEPSYVINFTGTTCPTSTITSVTPSSGPAGTDVIITASGGDLSGTTVMFNAVPATIISSSATQLVVTVPEDATTGNIVITKTATGCITTTPFTVIYETGACAVMTELIMTEIYDKDGDSLGYIEVYNGTGSTIDLTTYFIRRYADNAGYLANNYTDYAFAPSITTIADGQVKFGRISADPNLITPDFDYSTPGFAGINGDDIFHLYHGTTIVDVYVVPNDTIGYTAKRNLTTIGPNTTSNPSDWTHTTVETTADLGLFPYVAPTSNIPTVNTDPVDLTTCNLTASFSVTATAAGAGSLTYQWQYNSGVTTGWAPIAAGTFLGVTASGFASSTLSFTGVIGTLNGYQFYCQVIQDGTCTVASDAAQLTVSTTIWNGTAWSNLDPTLSKQVIINGNYNMNVPLLSFEACSVYVKSPFVLTISAAKYVAIQNNLTVEVGANVIVEDNGSLVQIDDNGVNTGSIDVKRIATMKRYDYVYWSSAVASFGVTSISPATAASLIWKWNPTGLNANGGEGNWENTTETMLTGKGYIVRGPSTFNNTTAQDFTATFRGVPYNGIKQPSISRGNDLNAGSAGPNGVMRTIKDDNWNLVGNPYASSISAVSFLTANTNIEGAIRLWTHGTLPSAAAADPFYGNYVYNYSTSDYITYNSSGVSSGPSAFNGYIASGQGFFVIMNDGAAGSGTVTFNNAMRRSVTPSTYYDNSYFYRSTASTATLDVEEEITERHRIWLDLLDFAGTTTRTLVAYVTGATLAKDRLFDSYTKIGASQNFYSIISNDIVNIQGRPLPFTDSDSVPLGIKVNTSGSYTIAIATTDGLFEGANQNIYLEDTSLNIIHDLRQAPYIFTAAAGRNDTRFKLRYTNTAALGTGDFETLNNSVVVSTPGNNQIALQSTIEYMKRVVVYDILGRIVYNNDSVNAGQLQISDVVLNQQALIVKITLENGQVVTRKIVF